MILFDSGISFSSISDSTSRHGIPGEPYNRFFRVGAACGFLFELGNLERLS